MLFRVTLHNTSSELRKLSEYLRDSVSGSRFPWHTTSSTRLSSCSSLSKMLRSSLNGSFNGAPSRETLGKLGGFWRSGGWRYSLVEWPQRLMQPWPPPLPSPPRHTWAVTWRRCTVEARESPLKTRFLQTDKTTGQPYAKQLVRFRVSVVLTRHVLI